MPLGGGIGAITGGVTVTMVMAAESNTHAVGTWNSAIKGRADVTHAMATGNNAPWIKL